MALRRSILLQSWFRGMLRSNQLISQSKRRTKNENLVGLSLKMDEKIQC